MKANSFVPFMRSKKYLAPGIYGSTLASSFFKDAVNGADSLDVLTIGDSNAGYSYGGFGGGGGGWTRGMLRGLNNAGVPTYGSGMAPIMHTGVTTTTQVLKEDDGTTVTTILGYAKNTEAPTGNLLRGGASGPAAITAIAVPATTLLPYGLTNFDFAWVAASTTYQTFAQPALDPIYLYLILSRFPVHQAMFYRIYHMKTQR
jgi:hypothetical protein